MKINTVYIHCIWKLLLHVIRFFSSYIVSIYTKKTRKDISVSACDSYFSEESFIGFVAFSWGRRSKLWLSINWKSIPSQIYFQRKGKYVFEENGVKSSVTEQTKFVTSSTTTHAMTTESTPVFFEIITECWLPSTNRFMDHFLREFNLFEN